LPKHFTINDPVYGVDIEVYCGSHTEMVETASQRGHDLSWVPRGLNAGTMSWTSNIGLDVQRTHFAIYFPDCEPSPALMAHEAVHAAIMILGMKQITFTRRRHEVLAYYVEFLVKSLLDNLKGE
jgi:hypothetical protein